MEQICSRVSPLLRIIICPHSLNDFKVTNPLPRTDNRISNKRRTLIFLSSVLHLNESRFTFPKNTLTISNFYKSTYTRQLNYHNIITNSSFHYNIEFRKDGLQNSNRVYNLFYLSKQKSSSFFHFCARHTHTDQIIIN